MPLNLYNFIWWRYLSTQITKNISVKNSLLKSRGFIVQDTCLLSLALSVSQFTLMKRWSEVHSHWLAVKMGPERETVPSTAEQEQLWFFWFCDLRAEWVQHQRPGYGILERPEHKWVYCLFLPVRCKLGTELLVNFELPCPSGTPHNTVWSGL